MKKAILFSTVLASIGFMYSNLSAQQVNEDFKKLDWLEGTWIRTNVKPGRTAHEKWEKISFSEWRGCGVNMKGNDTVFVERLKLIIKDDNIYYVADIVENNEPVYFKLTSITDKSFVCENPQHDFPKMIRYQKDGNRINASISGNGRSIDYLFEKE